jgi:hypothetical protein
MRILKRREANGQFYSLWDTPQYCASVATNGVWFACATNTDLKIFTFNDDLFTYRTLLSYPGTYFNLKFLSDGSLVAANTITVVTRVYNGAAWTIVNETAISSEKLPSIGVIMRLTDTSLVYTLGSKATLMRRNQDYSWTLVEQVDISPSQSTTTAIVWANDTLVVSYYLDEPSNGYSTVLRVYVKTNNAWNIVLETVGTDLIEPDGALGYIMLQLSDTQILIGAFNDGYSTFGEFGAGSVLSLDRGADNQWKFTARILPDVRDRHWGYALLNTDTELLIWGCVNTKILIDAEMRIYIYQTVCGFSVIPRCFKDPIDVTCVNQQLGSCSDLNNFNTDDLYNLQNPGCGITKGSPRIGFGNGGLEISFDFTRFGVPLASCNATLTCPIIPLGNSPSGSASPATPVTQNSPQSEPPSPVTQPSIPQSIPSGPQSVNIPLPTPAEAARSQANNAVLSLVNLTTTTLVTIALLVGW